MNTAGSSPYFNYQLMAEKKLDPVEVQRVAAEAIAAAPHVARVYTREQLLTSRASVDKFDVRVLRGFNANRSGDLKFCSSPTGSGERRKRRTARHTTTTITFLLSLWVLAFNPAATTRPQR